MGAEAGEGVGDHQASHCMGEQGQLWVNIRLSMGGSV